MSAWTAGIPKHVQADQTGEFPRASMIRCVYAHPSLWATTLLQDSWSALRVGAWIYSPGRLWDAAQIWNSANSIRINTDHASRNTVEMPMVLRMHAYRSPIVNGSM